jgi:hypothetical protein
MRFCVVRGEAEDTFPPDKACLFGLVQLMKTGVVGLSSVPLRWEDEAMSNFSFPPKASNSTTLAARFYSGRTVGAALCGRPRLVNKFKKRARPRFGRRFRPRAATEGRPYSTSQVVTRLSANNTDRRVVTCRAAEGDADAIVALDID